MAKSKARRRSHNSKSHRRVKRPIYYYLELYRTQYYYCLGWNASEVEALLLKLNATLDSAIDGAGACLQIDSPTGHVIIIWTKRKCTTILAHECLHAANMTLSWIGWRADMNNDEPQAYLMHHLMEKVS